jgi:hypothetical protein
VTTTETTPALRQAEFLVALATHLTDHPHLHIVFVHENGRLQLTWTSRSAHELVAWAETLHNPRITVRGIKGEAFVYVNAAMLGHKVQVWDTVPGLYEELGMDDVNRDAQITLERLREFAATSDAEAVPS